MLNQEPIGRAAVACGTGWLESFCSKSGNRNVAGEMDPEAESPRQPMPAKAVIAKPTIRK